MFDPELTLQSMETETPIARAAPTRRVATRLNAVVSNPATVSFADLAADAGAPIAIDPQLAPLAFPVRRVRAGEVLHLAGDRCDAIYIVRAGYFKTVSVQASGIEQIVAFPMRGDAIGLDGIDDRHYQTHAIALETSLVAVISLDRLSGLGNALPAVERLMHFMFSREVRQQQQMLLLLGSLSADARVAAFLLHLVDKMGRLGFSRTSLILRMSRQEIGSYLGIKLETVSRCLSSFASAGLIEVDLRSIVLRDICALRDVAAPPVNVPRSLRPKVAAARSWSDYEARDFAHAMAAP